jgi:hypothetical protein
VKLKKGNRLLREPYLSHSAFAQFLDQHVWPMDIRSSAFAVAAPLPPVSTVVSPPADAPAAPLCAPPAAILLFGFSGSDLGWSFLRP